MNFETLILALGIILVLEGSIPLFFTRCWQEYLVELAKMQPSKVQRFAGALVIIGIMILVIFS